MSVKKGKIFCKNKKERELKETWIFEEKTDSKKPRLPGVLKRRRPDLNRCIRVLQTYAARPATPHSYWLCCPSDPHDHLKSTLLYGGSQFLNQTDYSITRG